MRRGWLLLILIWFVIGLSLLTLGYLDTIYKLEIAIGYINRAQSAGFAEEMIEYIDEALAILPKSGNPVWLFPTERTNFSLIYSDLLSIRERLGIVSTIARDSPAYAQSLNDIRGKLKVIIEQIGEAMPYTLITPMNIALSMVWLSIPYVAYKVASLYNNSRKRVSGGVDK